MVAYQSIDSCSQPICTDMVRGALGLLEVVSSLAQGGHRYTSRIAQVLNHVSVRILDHIIVDRTRQDDFSFARAGIVSQLSGLVPAGSVPDRTGRPERPEMVR